MALVFQVIPAFEEAVSGMAIGGIRSAINKLGVAGLLYRQKSDTRKTTTIRVGRGRQLSL
ncbi:unnamed protein product [Arabis nemorensis]|uniref:Uncharacterized protein n=1 Tax=Arabis nemorensis TaxID=586526 RepID=A0A565CKY2_9BRAS|nr:unnamed protein product [Arabis nemorensis]